VAILGSTRRRDRLAEVRFEGVSKTYPPRRRGGEPVPVLRDLDLRIADGEFLVLVGPSGCGKSTLLRLLAGLDEPSAGEIYVGDRPVSAVRPAERNVAMVFQSYALYPHLSVAGNLSFGLRRRQSRSLGEEVRDGLHRLSRPWPRPLRFASPREERIEARVREVAALLEIQPLLERLPKELSGGQKQRVALGRAIARQPEVFLMDEPLSNLDAKLRAGTRTQIVELQRQLGTTTLYVTHDQVEAMTMGHRIALLHQGRLQQLGTPLELYRHPANLFVAQFIGSPPMNLLPVEVVGPGLVLLAGKKFSLPDALEPLVAGRHGQRLTGGLRPEHLHLAPATNRNLPAEVSHVEALGNEQLVTCRLLEGSELVHVRVGPEQELRLGESVHLEVEAAGWRLFDAAGDALAPKRQPEPEPRGQRREPQLPRLG
jgi:multiple sugar transport system ATP-binding protein